MNKYTWMAIYNDGTSLLQYRDGKEISVDIIEKKKLYQFRLLDEHGDIKFVYEYKKGQCPFYRRRTAISPDGILEVIHIIGSRETINDIANTYVSYLYESNGRVEVGDFNPNVKWKHSIEFYDNDNIAVE